MAKSPDLSKMRQLAGRIDDLGRIPSQAARGAAERINALLSEQFDNGVDPYGRAQAPLAERTLEKHGEPSLQGEFGARPGDMAEGTQVHPASGAGIEVTVPFPGAIHQTGAQSGNWRMPRRPILPDGAKLPADWKEAIDESVREAAGSKGKR